MTRRSRSAPRVVVALLCVAGCGDFERGHSSDNDHNFGTLCTGCHWPGSESLTLSGSVRIVGGGEASVLLHTQPGGQGELVAEVPVGQWGNFHSTADIEWGDGLYPSVMSAGDTRHMPMPTTNSECNICHDGHMLPYLTIE